MTLTARLNAAPRRNTQIKALHAQKAAAEAELRVARGTGGGDENGNTADGWNALLAVAINQAKE